MTNFFKHVKSLKPKERTEFRKRIIELCQIQPPTWYSWLRREIVPNASQILISKELGYPRETLFPTSKT